jgi:hypothetical protein
MYRCPKQNQLHVCLNNLSKPALHAGWALLPERFSDTHLLEAECTPGL